MIMQNPCYDESVLGDKNKKDEIALIELVKRKRLVQLKTDESIKSKGE